MAETKKGQARIEEISQEALQAIRLNDEHKSSFFEEALADLASVEQNTIDEYHGRYIFELLQNANDAIRDARNGAEYQRKTYRFRIQLTQTALIVANDGVPFLEKDAESIYRWGASSKKDPGKSIGYKGIGFKSVFEISESPQIFSQIVQFHFDRATCYSKAKEILGERPDLQLPINRFIFPFSINEIPSPDRELVDQLLNHQGYATVIRLPLLDKIQPESVIQRIQEDIDPTLLLFLNGIDEIEVWIKRKKYRTLARKVIIPSSTDELGQNVTLFENNLAVSRWLLFDAPKQPVTHNAHIQEIGNKTWNRVKKVGFALAFPLDDHLNLDLSVETSNLFVYFPTQIDSGLKFRVHGDFFVDANRKTIQASWNYNIWLLQQIAKFFGEVVLPELQYRFAENSTLIRMLVPVSRQDFAAELQSALEKVLKDAAFVEDSHGVFVAPYKLLLTPAGLQGRLKEFFQYFPETNLLEINPGRRFPAESLYVHPDCMAFLSRLGAQPLYFEDVFRLLNRSHPVNLPGEYSLFYNFLWMWREEQIDSSARASFSEDLSKTKFIVP